MEPNALRHLRNEFPLNRAIMTPATVHKLAFTLFWRGGNFTGGGVLLSISIVSLSFVLGLCLFAVMARMND